jgi:hypothetical protein
MAHQRRFSSKDESYLRGNRLSYQELGSALPQTGKQGVETGEVQKKKMKENKPKLKDIKNLTSLEEKFVEELEKKIRLLEMQNALLREEINKASGFRWF